MSDQDQPIPHAVNNDRGRRGWQDCDSAVNCGKLAIRHGQVPFSRRTRKGELRIKPQQGGSGGPRAVLAYYFAMAHTACKYSPALIPSLVIDSPHQKAQDEINRPLVTEFIFRNRPPSQQLIVCLEEPLPASVQLGNEGKAVPLSVKYGLLNDNEFQHVADLLRPLMESSTEHLRSKAEADGTVE